MSKRAVEESPETAAGIASTASPAKKPRLDEEDQMEGPEEEQHGGRGGDEGEEPGEAPVEDAPQPEPTPADLEAMKAFLQPYLLPLVAQKTAEDLAQMETNAFMLFNGFSREIQNVPLLLKDVALVVFNNVLLIQTKEGSVLTDSAVSALLELIPAFMSVVLKKKSYANGIFRHNNVVARGEVPETFTISEHGVKYQVHVKDKLDPGIHLDIGEARRWLKENSKNKRLCNLFSYTCGFGVAAGVGGASFTDNVDSSASALQTGRVNYELNKLKLDNRNFNQKRVDKFIREKNKRFPKGFYDIVIADPSPPPPHLNSTEDKVNKFYVPLFRQACRLVADGGVVLISCHPKDVSDELFTSLLLAQDYGRKSVVLQEKIPYPPAFNVAATKMFIFKVGEAAATVEPTSKQ